jgi:hypothetical protein
MARLEIDMRGLFATPVAAVQPPDHAARNIPIALDPGA